MKALGMIEVYGYLAAVEALDSALKAANVSLVDTVCVKGGLVTVLVEGDVGAVKASMDASAAAAERVGRIVSVHVIPRPADEVMEMLRPDRSQPSDPEPPTPGPEPDEPKADDPEPDAPQPEEDVSDTDIPEADIPDTAIPETDTAEPEETEPDTETDDPEPEMSEPEETDGVSEMDDEEPLSEMPTRDQMEQMTVETLRSLARKIEITNMTRHDIRFARKKELIHAILENTGQEN